MSSLRQIIYLLLFIILIAAAGLSITKLAQDNSVSGNNSDVVNTSASESQNIDWNTATQLMRDCQVKVIFQKHNLEVSLRTHDLKIYQTVEPKIDAIFDLAKKYQGPCDIVQMITE